ncbi:MFS transporter [Actinocrispum wychmicini]|uniref:Sugar phosphate permease n=1 Tax=Actinocrispum wychmicini TaxID=1213861 RepID=A0A4R2JNT0_9PSEU|nr:MFS transporter [Actinocrispum wychmicini]TCO60637.1 sugar phosphate permease [Actinocrispum wychmicini]
MTERTPKTRRLAEMKRWTYILPVIVFIYVICYIDRTNISFALPHLKTDMGLSGAQQGLASGIFFWGYLLLQIPGGYMAERWSAKRWIAILMVLWSIAAMASGFVNTFGELILARFLLGVAEGGVQPALMATIRCWFPFAERSRAYAIFKLYTPIAAILAAPFSGLILTFADWRWMFIIQGGGPLVVGLIAWLVVMRDTPAKAGWLSVNERNFIERSRLEEGEPLKHRGTFKAAFSSGIVWHFALTYTLTQMGLLGLTLWLPSVLKKAFHTDMQVGFVAILPQIAAGIAIILIGRSADRRGGHVAHMVAVLVAGALILSGASLISPSQKWLVLGALILGTAASIAWYGPFWATVTKLVPLAAAGAGMGLINGVGNLGSFIGPYVGGWLTDLSGGGYALTQAFFGLVFALAALLVLPLRKKLRAAANAEPVKAEPVPAVKD